MRGNTTEEMDTLGAENIKSKNSQTQNIHNFSLQKKLRGKNGEERGKGGGRRLMEEVVPVTMD